MGIDPEHHDLIFQEFSQVENPFQRRSGGAGLGLPLSRKLATFLGGSISVASSLGRGATFTVVIPRVFSEPAAREEAGIGGAEPARSGLLGG